VTTNDTTKCPLVIQWETLPAARQPRVITSYSLESAFMTSTDGWSVSLYDTDPERLRWLALEPLTLLIHDRPQLVGRVERISRGANGGEVTIGGRDHISTIVEGNIDPTVKITEDMTLAGAILLAAGPYGISTVFGPDDAQMADLKSGASMRAGRDQGFADLVPGNLKPDPGMGVYEWLTRLCARMGCTIQPGPDRTSLVLAAPNYEQSTSLTVLRSLTRSRYNVKAAQSEEDYSSFPTVGLATGKVTETGKKSEAAVTEYDIGAVISGLAPALFEKIGARLIGKRVLPTAATDPGPNLYRLLYVKDEQSRKPEQVERAISRAVSERLRATLDYQVTLRGHQDPTSGACYAVDTMADVQDDICDIRESLWVASRRFSYSRGAGAETMLTMLRPGSLIL
jgi:prophage tail gpP-like protein